MVDLGLRVDEGSEVLFCGNVVSIILAMRRREGNRRAAQRLRQRRMETVSRLQAEINRLEQERLVYLNHIYQLAASARSVVAENKELRGRLEAFQSGSSALVRPPDPFTITIPALFCTTREEHRFGAVFCAPAKTVFAVVCPWDHPSHAGPV